MPRFFKVSFVAKGMSKLATSDTVCFHGPHGATVAAAKCVAADTARTLGPGIRITETQMTPKCNREHKGFLSPTAGSNWRWH